MPDFQKMHEDWEAKQRELREATRKPATKPVAFSLSSSVCLPHARCDSEFLLKQTKRREKKKRNSIEKTPMKATREVPMTPSPAPEMKVVRL